MAWAVRRFRLRQVAAEPVHEPDDVVPVHPDRGSVLQVGDGRQQWPGAEWGPSRVYLVLYSPMVVSARALSKASPTVPIEGLSPASRSVSVMCTEVYCPGRSGGSRCCPGVALPCPAGGVCGWPVP